MKALSKELVLGFYKLLSYNSPILLKEIIPPRPARNKYEINYFSSVTTSTKVLIKEYKKFLLLKKQFKEYSKNFKSNEYTSYVNIIAYGRIVWGGFMIPHYSLIDLKQVCDEINEKILITENHTAYILTPHSPYYSTGEFSSFDKLKDNILNKPYHHYLENIKQFFYSEIYNK